jgi:hypothetical protein
MCLIDGQLAKCAVGLGHILTKMISNLQTNTGQWPLTSHYENTVREIPGYRK